MVLSHLTHRLINYENISNQGVNSGGGNEFSLLQNPALGQTQSSQIGTIALLECKATVV